MDLLIGTLFLILVLVIFTLFTYKAPSGMRAMGALANAAIASFLVEAFNKYVGGQVFGIKFLEELGDAAGGLGGVAAAGLTALAIGVSPVYALVIGALWRYGLVTRIFRWVYCRLHDEVYREICARRY